MPLKICILKLLEIYMTLDRLVYLKYRTVQYFLKFLLCPPKVALIFKITLFSYTVLGTRRVSVTEFYRFAILILCTFK